MSKKTLEDVVAVAPLPWREQEGSYYTLEMKFIGLEMGMEGRWHSALTEAAPEMVLAIRALLRAIDTGTEVRDTVSLDALRASLPEEFRP